MTLPKGQEAYLVAQVVATYVDIMEHLCPGFSTDIDGVFLAANDFVKHTLSADLECPNNAEAMGRALRAAQAKRLRKNIELVRN